MTDRDGLVARFNDGTSLDDTSAADDDSNCVDIYSTAILHRNQGRGRMEKWGMVRNTVSLHPPWFGNDECTAAHDKNVPRLQDGEKKEEGSPVQGSF